MVYTIPKSRGASGLYRTYQRGESGSGTTGSIGGINTGGSNAGTPVSEPSFSTTRNIGGGQVSVQSNEQSSFPEVIAERKRLIEEEQLAQAKTEGLKQEVSQKLVEQERQKKKINVAISYQQVEDMNRKFREAGVNSSEQFVQGVKSGNIEVLGEGRYNVKQTSQPETFKASNTESTTFYPPRNVSLSESKQPFENDTSKYFEEYKPKVYTGATIGANSQIVETTPISKRDSFIFNLQESIARTQSDSNTPSNLQEIGLKGTAKGVVLYAGSSFATGVSDTLIYPIVDYTMEIRTKGIAKGTFVFGGKLAKGMGETLLNPVDFVSTEVSTAINNPFESAGRVGGFYIFGKGTAPVLNKVNPLKVVKVQDMNFEPSGELKSFQSLKTTEGTTTSGQTYSQSKINFDIYQKDKGGSIYYFGSTEATPDLSGKGFTKSYEVRLFEKKLVSVENPYYSKVLEKNPIYKELVDNGFEIELAGGQESLQQRMNRLGYKFNIKTGEYEPLSKELGTSRFAEPEQPKPTSEGSNFGGGGADGFNPFDNAFEGVDLSSNKFGGTNKKLNKYVFTETESGQVQVQILNPELESSSFIFKLKQQLGSKNVQVVTFPVQKQNNIFSQSGATFSKTSQVSGLSQLQSQSQIQSQVQVQKQTNVQSQLQRQFQRQNQFQNQLQTQTQSQLQSQLQVQKQVQLQKQLQVQKQLQLQSQLQVQKQVQVQTQVQVQKLIQITKIIETPIFIPLKSNNEKKSLNLFNVFVKRRGKFFQANKNPLPESIAFKTGANIVENTASATFKIQPINFAGSYNSNLKDKDFYSKGNLFIERRNKRINTFGELKDITFFGAFKKRNIPKIFGR